MSSPNRIFVQCAHIQCDQYVPQQSPKEIPLCTFHRTHNPTNTKTSKEILEAYDTSGREFFERCEILRQRVAQITAEFNSEKHGKMIRWNKNFEMCSSCGDVTTCTYFFFLKYLIAYLTKYFILYR
jgi:hypothetical protein